MPELTHRGVRAAVGAVAQGAAALRRARPPAAGPGRRRPAATGSTRPSSSSVRTPSRSCVGSTCRWRRSPTCWRSRPDQVGVTVRAWWDGAAARPVGARPGGGPGPDARSARDASLRARPGRFGVDDVVVADQPARSVATIRQHVLQEDLVPTIMADVTELRAFLDAGGASLRRRVLGAVPRRGRLRRRRADRGLRAVRRARRARRCGHPARTSPRTRVAYVPVTAADCRYPRDHRRVRGARDVAGRAGRRRAGPRDLPGAVVRRRGRGARRPADR